MNNRPMTFRRQSQTLREKKLSPNRKMIIVQIEVELWNDCRFVVALSTDKIVFCHYLEVYYIFGAAEIIGTCDCHARNALLNVSHAFYA
jgi:hypothetical protein